jgi:hypothetical protein
MENRDGSSSRNAFTYNLLSRARVISALIGDSLRVRYLFLLGRWDVGITFTLIILITKCPYPSVSPLRRSQMFTNALYTCQRRVIVSVLFHGYLAPSHAKVILVKQICAVMIVFDFNSKVVCMVSEGGRHSLFGL